MNAAPGSPSTSSKPSRGSKSPATDKPAPPEGPWREPIPMKPRKGLFIVLLTVLMVWCAVMVAMYYKSVRSNEAAPATRTVLTVVESHSYGSHS